MINKGKITKNIKSKVQDVNSEKGIVTIQITQFDKYDSDNDRLLKGALTKTWNEGQQVHLVDHKMGMSTYVGLPLTKDPVTGIIESQLNLNKQIGIDLFEDYKFSQEHGRSLQHSHGFIAIKNKYKENEKGGYDFSEIKQYEYSTVIFGAVSDTPAHQVKSIDSLSQDIIDLEFKLKHMNYSDEKCLLLEQKLNELKNIIKEPQSHSKGKDQKAVFDTFKAINNLKF